MTTDAVICIVGPTASGKTDLAIELAQRCPAELISVDSAMVYRGMDIGTAKPTREQLRLTPHHLIDICDPSQTYCAAQFCQDARQYIEQAHRQHRLPVLVGGTLLYIHLLLQGMADLPGADAQLRKQLQAQAQQHGWSSLYDQLQQVDAAAARQIDPQNHQRLLRALEVYQLTGQPISQWWQRQRQMHWPYPLYLLMLWPAQRTVLHQHIAQRFHLLLAQGLEHEVAQLRARGDLHRDLPSMRCVGYRQMWQYLDGQIDRGQMIEHSIAATRQLAKRQFTWLRKLHCNWQHQPPHPCSRLQQIDAYDQVQRDQALAAMVQWQAHRS